MDTPAKVNTVLLLIVAAVALGGCVAREVMRSGPPPGWAEAQDASAPRRGFLSAVGVAGPEESEPADAADRMARQELASTVAGYAEKAVTEFAESREDGPPADSPAFSVFREALVGEVAGALLRQSLEPEKWREDDGRLFVLYQVPAGRVDERLTDRARALLPHHNPFGQQPDAVVRELESFLRDRTRRQKLEAARARSEDDGESETGVAPDWLETGSHPDYEAAKFLTVIGVGPGQMESREDGRAELAAWLNGRLDKLIPPAEATDQQSAFADNLAALPNLSVRFSPEELRVVRFPESWYDPITDSRYTLTVMNRDTATVLLRQQATDAAVTAESFLASGNNHEKAGNYAEALQNYLDALTHAQGAVTLQCKALATAVPETAGQMRELLPEPLAARTKDRLRALLARVKVEKVRGDRQWLDDDAAPRQAFVARIVVGEEREPLPDVPLRMFVGRERRRPFGQVSTDANGTAEWTLGSPPPTEKATGALVAELALDRMAPTADLSGIEMPSVSFEYAFRSRENTRYVLAVHGGRAAVAVRTALESTLTSEGLEPVAQALLLKRIRPAPADAAPTDEQLLERFSELRQELGPEKFLLIVGGSVETRLVEKTDTAEGTLYIVYCTYDIRALDGDLPGPDKRIAEAQGSGHGASLKSEGDAADRATADAVNKVTGAIKTALSRRFGPSEAHNRSAER